MHVSNRRKYCWWRISHLAVRAWQWTQSLNTSQTRVCRISRPHSPSGLKMRLGRAGYGRGGKARMGIGEGLEEMMCPNWDTFCSVSSDGGEIASPDLVIWLTFDHVSRTIPHNPSLSNFHHTATDCIVWGRRAVPHAGSWRACNCFIETLLPSKSSRYCCSPFNKSTGLTGAGLMLQARALRCRLALPSHPCQVPGPPTLQLRDEGKRQARLWSSRGEGSQRMLGRWSCDLFDSWSEQLKQLTNCHHCWQPAMIFR